MKKFRFSVLLLVLALLIASVSVVLAQDTLGASQDDYNLWTTANANFATVNTLTYNFTATLNVTGMSDPTDNVSANLTGSGVLDKTDMQNPSFQLDVTGSATQGGTSTPVTAGVRITGGNVYFTSDGTNWQGEALSDISSSMSSMFGQGFGAATGSAEATPPSLSSISSNPEAMQMMQALSQIKPSDFLTLTRADNNGLADFTLNIDIAKLLSSPAFTSAMNTAMSSASSEGAASTDVAQAQQYLGMAQMLFSTAKITLDQYVDPSSQLVQRTVLDVNVPLDSLMGPGAGVKANFDISLSNYNQPVTVQVPANVTMTSGSSSG